MRLKKTIIILIACLNTLVLKAQTNVAQRIDSLMQAVNGLGVFNGNVLVVQKGKTLYQNSLGYASGDKTKLLNKDLLFDIGSISKEFNSVGILLLKEQGKLKLENSLSKYLNELPQWADSIPVATLLNYTSGLPVTGATSDAQLLEELKQLKYLAFKPGSAYAYSYSNVYLQRRLIEKVSGLDYNAFVGKYLLKPLKMEHTLMDLNTNDPRMAIAFDSNFKNTPYAQGMSGWPRLTIGDLYKWVKGLDGYQLVNKASLEILAKSFGDNESSLGHADFKAGELCWHQHHGSNYNYEALITHDVPQDITIILTTNSQQFKVNQITNAILAILKGESYSVPKRSLYLDLREKVLANFNDGLAFYHQVKNEQEDRYDLSFEIGDLINTGRYLMRRKRFDDALALFQLGTLLPIKDSDFSFAYQLMAECYVNKGYKQLAIIYYQKAVEKDKTNENAKGYLNELMR